MVILFYGNGESMETTSVDRLGRVYLPKSIREKANLKPNTILEIEFSDDKIILKKKNSVVRESRGIFKLKKYLKEDIDELIEKYSYEEASEEV
jgi:AbrB family looped-hinge helix DNA binding protein